MLTVQSSLSEIMAALPGAKRALFSKYHLGGCQSCAFAPTESLTELASRNELNAAEMLSFLLDSDAHDQSLWIDPPLLKTWIDEKKTLRLVDIRTREEHEAVALPNAELFTQALQQELFSQNDSSACIVLFDHQGKHALDQVAWFRGHQLPETFALRGGIDAWASEIDPQMLRYQIEFE